MSPPGITDCSGSHWRMVPLTATVLTFARALSPPRAWTALLTRLSLRGDAVAALTTTSEASSSTAILLMVSPIWRWDRTWGPRRCQLADSRGVTSPVVRTDHGPADPRARSERSRARVPRRDREPRVHHAGRRERPRPAPSLDAIVGIARTRHPAAGPHALRIPSAPGRPYRVELLAGRQHVELGVVVALIGTVLGVASVLAPPGAGVSPARTGGTLSRLDVIATRAAATLPGARITAFIDADGGVIRVETTAGAVIVDRETGRVVREQGDQTRLTARDWITRLHYGDFAGWVSRVAYALVGLGLPVLSITGYLITARRTAGP